MAKRDVNIVFRATDKTARGLARVTKSVSQVGMRLSKVTAGFGVAAAAGSAAIVRSQMPVIDALGKTADRLGLTTEALGGLRHAAELAGVSQSTLDMSLQRFNRRLSEASSGSGEAVGALHELNLNARDLEKLPLDQQMMAVADAFGQVEGSGDRTRLAMKLFDSEGVALLNMLEGQSEGLKAAATEADKLGLTMSRMEVAQVEIANDAMTRLGAITTGVKNAFVVALAPAIEMVANFMAQLNVDTGQFGTISTMVNTVIKTVWGGLLDVFHGLKIAGLALRRMFLQIGQTLALNLAPAVQGFIDMYNNVANFFGMKEIKSNPLAEFGKAATRELQELNTAITELMTQELPSEQFGKKLDAFVVNQRERAARIANQVTPVADAPAEEIRELSQFERIKTRIMEQGLRARNEFEKKDADERAIHVVGQMSSLFSKNKKLQIANAIMQTYAGATKALSEYKPPLSFAMAAMTIASGLQQVRTIRSQSFEGGGFTGRGVRAGGVDGRGGFPAILHPNESVIDHNRSGQGVTIINNIDATGGADVDMIIAAAIEIASGRTIETIHDLMSRRRFA